jgi:hypothetical protein
LSSFARLVVEHLGKSIEVSFGVTLTTCPVLLKDTWVSGEREVSSNGPNVVIPIAKLQKSRKNGDKQFFYHFVRNFLSNDLIKVTLED